MTEGKYYLTLDRQGMENPNRAQPLFPCSIYQRDVHQYLTGEIPPHWHRELELFLLEKGHVRILLGDKTSELLPGEGYFANSNLLHGIFCLTDAPCCYHSIVFDPSILAGEPGSVFDVRYVRPFLKHGKPGFKITGDDEKTSPLFSLFQKAYQICEHPDITGYELSARNALSDLFLFLAQNITETPQTSSPSLQEQRMKQMVSWMEEHYREPFSVSQFANDTGLGIRQCQRSFSGFFHSTPIHYLTRRRIAAATELLISTDLPVIQIGIQCGFENPSYFAKQFKKIIGMSPREYRNQNPQNPLRF